MRSHGLNCSLVLLLSLTIMGVHCERRQFSAGQTATASTSSSASSSSNPSAPPVQVGIRPLNVLGEAQQHASFSFVRPGLTQTSFAFNGPSSHQSFSASIGNPHLAQRVRPNVAQALGYRNPGLFGGLYPQGLVPFAHAAQPGYAGQPSVPNPYVTPYFQQQPAIEAQVQAQPQPQLIDPITAAAYQQRQQLAALLQQQYPHLFQQVAAPAALEQVDQTAQQNQLGVLYSAGPSVAHVKVNGNGYKFDF